MIFSCFQGNCAEYNSFFAGVSPDRVKIISVERVGGSSTRSVSRTRPSSGLKMARTQIHIRVAGALRLNNMDKVLRKYGFPRSSKTKIILDHHVEARRRPERQVLG